MTIEELKTLDASIKSKFQKIQAKLAAKKAKADAPVDPKAPETEDEMCTMDDLMEAMDSLYNYISNSNSYIWDSIYATNQQMGKHCNSGHLPALTASQMKKVLDKCGLSEDFNVQPKTTIYASRQGNILEVDFSKK